MIQPADLPTDIRDCNWKFLYERLDSMRERVWSELLRHGPCTTAELAARADLHLLTVRPRVTELVQLGFVRITGRHNREGVYEALDPESIVAAWRDRLAADAARPAQTLLPL